MAKSGSRTSRGSQQSMNSVVLIAALAIGAVLFSTTAMKNGGGGGGSDVVLDPNLDTDGDGVIEANELITVAKPAQLNNDLDLDGDGIVEDHELDENFFARHRVSLLCASTSVIILFAVLYMQKKQAEEKAVADAKAAADKAAAAEKAAKEREAKLEADAKAAADKAAAEKAAAEKANLAKEEAEKQAKQAQEAQAQAEAQAREDHAARQHMAPEAMYSPGAAEAHRENRRALMGSIGLRRTATTHSAEVYARKIQAEQALIAYEDEKAKTEAYFANSPDRYDSRQTQEILPGLELERAPSGVAASPLTARAEKKFAQLDTDGNGALDKDEVLQLAEWVWTSLRPGQTITEEQKQAEAKKIWHQCDADGNGLIDKAEFAAYYEEKNAAIQKFRSTQAAENKEAAKHKEAASYFEEY